MLIIGAKGFAKELLQYFHKSNALKNLFFYDDISSDVPDIIYDKFRVLRTLNEAIEIFNTIEPTFVLGVGNPKIRYRLAEKMTLAGGQLSSVIAKNTELGSYNVVIGKGTNVMSGSVITNDITIGEGVLINLNCTIGHDSYIGNYCELSPGVHISGHVILGDFSSLGSGVVVIPGIHIGKNCLIGAGSVVNKDIPDNSVAVGVPAKIIKNIEPF